MWQFVEGRRLYLASNVLYAMSPRSVRDVLVDGAVLVRAGRLVRDAKTARAALHEAIARDAPINHVIASSAPAAVRRPAAMKLGAATKKTVILGLVPRIHAFAAA